MQIALAFLQTGADALACASAPLRPVAGPGSGRPAFFAPFFSLAPGAECWLESDSVDLLSRAGWQRRFPATGAPAQAPPWGPADEPRFSDGFRTLATHLEKGSLHKGVPVTVMSAPVGPGNADALFDHLLGRVPHLPVSLLAYGFYRPASETGTGFPEFLVGATPELLFEMEG